MWEGVSFMRVQCCGKNKGALEKYLKNMKRRKKGYFSILISGQISVLL